MILGGGLENEKMGQQVESAHWSIVKQLFLFFLSPFFFFFFFFVVAPSISSRWQKNVIMKVTTKSEFQNSI